MITKWIKLFIKNIIHIKLLITLLFSIFFIFNYIEIPKKVYLSDKTIKSLKQKYSDEFLCFFAETAFGVESNRVPRIIRKWNKEKISVAIASNCSSKEIEYVKYCINEANTISKTIKFYYTTTEFPDIIIFVSNNSNKRSNGFAYTIKNKIVKFHVNIYKSDNDLDIVDRYLFLHELFHALSCIARNSYTYNNCILGHYVSNEDLYQNEEIMKYTNIDKSLIDIMYNYDIPVGLTIETFKLQLNLSCSTENRPKLR